ncbi:MAG: DUF342 domain-containing protein [Rhodocyclaceae bacterium]|nr:DUF342 domain-containing protein [Rhodocyclaceae bacterium]MBX3668878.1 DUF342 domain-containing protein [Rhodocyclaceae bacterium]
MSPNPIDIGLKFELDASRRVLLASLQGSPAGATPPGLNGNWLQQAIADQGCGAWKIDAKAAGQVLQGCAGGKRLAPIPLAQAVDASCTVEVTRDAMQARLNITPPQGGAPITLDAVLAALSARNVCNGMLRDVIHQAVAQGSCSDLVVAQGTPVCHGEDARFESMLDLARSRMPRVDLSNRTDYRDLGEITTVKADTPLMRRHAPTAGTPGVTVTGNTIPPRPGRDARFTAGLKGVAYAPGDPDLLVAALAGQPLVVKGGMQVEPTYVVDSVDLASGNIEFQGSVVVRGDVQAGMRIKASGDIEVGGVVEAAWLDAGGDIIVKGGVVGDHGRRKDDPARVRCGGSLSAAYAQQATIEAGDSIFIDDIAVQSHLCATHHVMVGKTRRGQVLGGHIEAMLSVTAKVLGSPLRVPTQIDLGISPTLHSTLLDLAQQRDAKETQMLEVSKLLDLAARMPGRLPAETLEKARRTAEHLSATIADLRARQELLTQQIEVAQTATVTATQHLHEGVKVELGSQQFAVPGEHGPSVISLVDGSIALNPL